MRKIIGVIMYSVLVALAIKPALDRVGERRREAADAETERYVREELPGIIRNDVSIFFPAKVRNAASDSL